MTAFLFSTVNDATKPTFLRNLALAAGSGDLRIRLFEGSLLVALKSYSPIAATRDKTNSGETWIGDQRLFRVLALDLVETLAEKAHTVDDATFLECLLRDRVECIALSECTPQVANLLDELLRDDDGYLGFVVPDLGNPIHYDLFVDLLSSRSHISGNKLLEAWPEAMTLSQDFPPFTREAVLEYDFDDVSDPLPASEPLSALGARTVLRIESARVRNPTRLRQRIVQTALDSLDTFHIASPYSSRQPSAGEVLDCSTALEVSPDALRQKLVEYALNPEHIVGRHKARVFAAKLGVTKEQWLSIASQIVENVARADIYGLVQSEHGLKFRARLSVAGVDGLRANVETGWILLDKEIRLTTLYVADERDQHPSRQRSNRIARARPEVFYAELFQRAHAAGVAASAEILPSPLIFVANGRKYIANASGFAHVLVRDARTGFARWLLKSGKGSLGSRGGACAYAPFVDQSYERAEAYASAFAQVLRENDIECSVVAVVD